MNSNKTKVDHDKFMKLAIKEANLALEEGEVPIGAVIVMNGLVIAKGYNQVEKLKDSTAHAEIIALTSAYQHLGAKYIAGASIYVTIEPCLMCAGALHWSQANLIVFGAADIKNGYRKYTCNTHNTNSPETPFHPKAKVLTGICEQECADLLKSFFLERR